MSLCWLILQNGLYYYFYQLGLISYAFFSVTHLSFKDIIISNQFNANIILSYIPSNNVILGLRLPRLLWNWLIDCIYLYFSVLCVSPMWLNGKGYKPVNSNDRKFRELIQTLPWLNIMNIKDCDMWQVSVTRYGYRVRWLFPRSYVIEKFVIWFTEDRYPLLCFCNTINLYGDMAMLDSCSCYPPSNHLHAMHVLLFWKNRYKSNFLSIHSPTYKTSRAWLIQIDMWHGYGLRIAIILRLCVWVPV